MNNLTDYLKPDTPAEIIDRLHRLEATGRAAALESWERCRKADSRKPATWLAQFDGFKESPFAERESPDYWGQISYELANAAWDVRLMIAPDTSLETAKELAQGLADWVKRMTPEEYDDFRGHPAHGPRIEPPREQRHDNPENEPPF